MLKSKVMEDLLSSMSIPVALIKPSMNTYVYS